MDAGFTCFKSGSLDEAIFTRSRMTSAASRVMSGMCRLMPLTASGGADAVNSGAAETAGAAANDAAAGKKSKAVDAAKAKAAAAKKRSLKRL
jgi:hypothetical protein